jgi:hypothetical protein
MRDFVPVRSFWSVSKSTVRPRRRDTAAPTCDILIAASRVVRDVPRRDFLNVDANRIRRVNSFGPCVRTDCRLYRHRQAEDQTRYYCKPHSFTPIFHRRASRIRRWRRPLASATMRQISHAGRPCGRPLRDSPLSPAAQWLSALGPRPFAAGARRPPTRVRRPNSSLVL